MDRVSFRAKSFCWVAVVWAALRLRSLPFLVSVLLLDFGVLVLSGFGLLGVDFGRRVWCVCALLFEKSAVV